MVWSAVVVDVDSEDERDNGDNDCRINESKRGTVGGGQQLRISNDGPFLLEMPTTRRGGTMAVGSGLRLRNQWQRERENDGLRLQNQWHRERENDGLQCWQPMMTIVCWHMKKRAVAGGAATATLLCVKMAARSWRRSCSRDWLWKCCTKIKKVSALLVVHTPLNRLRRGRKENMKYRSKLV
ncbi:hypothetical protein GW17_00015315 [Ensete ventricosum]|nr:hypothetical protein GW17_00015315 [Ensete ventricosum]